MNGKAMAMARNWKYGLAALVIFCAGLLFSQTSFRTVSATCIYGSLIFFVYYFVYCVLKTTGVITTIKSFSKWQIIALFAVFLGINVVAVSFVSREEYIYVWDTGGYWIKTGDVPRTV